MHSKNEFDYLPQPNMFLRRSVASKYHIIKKAPANHMEQISN